MGRLVSSVGFPQNPTQSRCCLHIHPETRTTVDLRAFATCGRLATYAQRATTFSDSLRSQRHRRTGWLGGQQRQKTSVCSQVRLSYSSSGVSRLQDQWRNPPCPVPLQLCHLRSVPLLLALLTVFFLARQAFALGPLDGHKSCKLFFRKLVENADFPVPSDIAPSTYKTLTKSGP